MVCTLPCLRERYRHRSPAGDFMERASVHVRAAHQMGLEVREKGCNDMRQWGEQEGPERPRTSWKLWLALIVLLILALWGIDPQG
jgi:hypothetical protein